MKNILIIDGARNATFSVFQAAEDEYPIIFPHGQDMELIDDLIQRLGDDEAGRFLGGPLGNALFSSGKQWESMERSSSTTRLPGE